MFVGLSGDVKRNPEIGTISSWGPQYRVSFDLKINSHVVGNSGGWSVIIDFKSDGARSDNRKIGDRIPSLFINRKRFLHFTTAINGIRNYAFDFHSIDVNKWYSITIQQKKENGKVKEA